MSASNQFGWSASRPSTASPFGNLPFSLAGGAANRYARPLGQAFGLGEGRRYDQLMQSINSGEAQGPLADLIRQGQGILPTLVPQATALGNQISQQGNQAFGGFEQSINQLLAQLPNLQRAMGSVGVNFMQGQQQAQDLTQRGQGVQAQGANILTQGIERANAQTPENEALAFARQQAQQAFSPVQGNALYQNAARQSADITRQGAAARGTLDTGGAQATEERAARDLAAQFAQNQFANQQAATQGLGGLAAQSAATQLANQGLGLQQAGLGAGIQGQGLGAQGTGLEGFLNATSGLGQTVAGKGELARMGPEAAGALFNAVPQLATLLQGAQQLPLQALQNQMGFIQGTQNPSLALLQQVLPTVGQRSSSFQGGGSAGIS